jgi:hypothetical protein
VLEVETSPQPYRQYSNLVTLTMIAGVARLDTDELVDAGVRTSARRVRWSSPTTAREGGTMSEQPTDRTAGTEEEAAKPETRDEQYGHLTVEDDPEGTTDEAELLSRHRSQDEA